VAPIAETLWAAHAGADYTRQGIGYQAMPAPQYPFREQVWQHDMRPDGEGSVRVALLNDRLGLGFMMETRAAQFPCHFQWQNLRAGYYALGIEPATNHVLGRRFAEDRGELIWLGHDEERQYDTVFSVLDGKAAIAAAETAIRAVTAQPEEAYPAPSGRFPPLSHRSA
jgi:hypothetical protein